MPPRFCMRIWPTGPFRLIATLSFLLICVGHSVTLAETSERPSSDRSKPARPVDLALTRDESQLLVCNQRRGTICFIDTKSLKVTNEVGVGANPSAIAWVEDGRIAIADESQHVIRICRVDGSSLFEVSKIPISNSPVNVILSAGKKELFVTSLWSHRWSSIDVTDPKSPVVKREVDLPFAPRHQFQLDSRLVLVTDAFGGRWLLIDRNSGEIARSGEFSGSHNMMGIARSVDTRKVFVPHMTLSHEKPTTEFNVHWGDVMLNVVRSISVDELTARDSTDRLTDQYSYLGHPDSAAGDPTGIIVMKNGRQIVCFAGVGEVGISDVGVNSFARVAVGRRPIAMALTADESRLFVANNLDDSISVIDAAGTRLIAMIRLPGVKSVSQIHLGEQLFYDSKLSSDGWFSCHSCHTDGHSNGGLADTFGDGKPGDAKRVLSLLGAAETGPWAWNGKSESMKDQIHKSIVTTMRGPTPTAEQVEAITAYVSQLQAPPAVQVARAANTETKIAAGMKLFHREGCADCHQPATFTSHEVYDVGLKDQLGNSQFNPPSLLGVSQRARLFHDNRANSVKDVLTRFKHQVESSLTEAELDELAMFVLSL